MDTQRTKLLGTTMTVEFHNLPLKKMEVLKSCITELVGIKDKIIMPGQIIIHLDEKGNVMQIDVRAIAYKRKKKDNF